jgi:cytochrome c biogenesis protein CcdA
MNAKVATLLGIALVLVASVVFLKSGSTATAALWTMSNEGSWLLPLVGVAALIDSINPCAFSVLIVTVAFLLSLGKLRSHVLEIGAAYILGIFLIYMLIGLGMLQVLHLFDTPHFMAKLGASVLILLGLLSLTNHFVPAFPVKVKIPQFAKAPMAQLMEKASLPSAFVLGGLTGLCEFPCTGGPYLMVIGLLHDRGTHLAGLGYLLLYNLIFILPLVVILLLASERSLLAKVEGWKKNNTGAMRLWGGQAMVLLGALIFAI